MASCLVARLVLVCSHISVTILIVFGFQDRSSETGPNYEKNVAIKNIDWDSPGIFENCVSVSLQCLRSPTLGVPSQRKDTQASRLRSF